MRLTLRTLLAYLDDILDPTEAREMGAKVAESGTAQSLIKRIQEVMRRRRLLAPDVDGPGMGVDPNVVAEYLDNMLPPNDVVDVEKVCRESDIHLAEVAACHQILSLVLGEPVDVVPRSRERIYALGPLSRTPGGAAAATGRPADGSDRPVASRPTNVAPLTVVSGNGAAHPRGDRRPAPSAPSHVAEGSSFADRIPEYLRPRPLWQRALPWVAFLGMAAAFAFLLSSDPDFRLFGGKPEADPAVASNEKPIDAHGANDGSGEKTASPANPSDAKATNPANDVAVASNDGNPEKAVPIDPPPPNDAATPAETADSTAPVKLPGSATAKTPDQVASVTKPADKGTPAPPAPGAAPPATGSNTKPVNEKPVEVPAAPMPQPMETVRIEYTSNEGVLLHYDAAKQDWYPLPRRSLVHAAEPVATPEPFESTLSIDKGRATATIHGGTAATILGTTTAAPFGFDVRQGRIVVQTRAPEDAAAEDFTFALSAGPATAAKPVWRIDLKGKDSTCAIEVTPREPDGFVETLGPITWVGRIYVTAGSAVVTEPSGRKVTLDARTALAIEPPMPGAGEQPAVTADPPKWMDANTTRTITRRNVTQFQNAFEPDLSVNQTVIALLDDSSFQISELAAKSLALTQNYTALVKALSKPQHKETRIAAINGLRVWLGSANENGALLKRELLQQFVEPEVGPIEDLLWGVTQEDARDATKSAQLIDYLESDQIAIRELAFYHILRLTGLKSGFGYDAQGSPQQRALSVKSWRSHVKKQGEVLLKK